MKLWGGRFKTEESKLMEDFNSSLKFDKVMYFEDISGSIAHVKMLLKSEILMQDEADTLIKGLNEILEEIESGTLKIEGDYEDIHSFVEINLVKKVGDVGKKLHTARSRNDQVAVDMRMYTKKKALEIVDSIQHLQDVIKDKADKNNYIMPGYTHLQRGSNSNIQIPLNGLL